MADKYDMWVDSLWAIRGTTIAMNIGDISISKKASVSMAIKSTNRAPSGVMHDALDKSLNNAMERELAIALSPDNIRKEIAMAITVQTDMEDTTLIGYSKVISDYNSIVDKIESLEKKENN